MSLVISAFEPFPRTAWWRAAKEADRVSFDRAEHFAKMSFRNRYAIATANGRLLLTVPLVKGRDQRTSMKDVLIANDYAWQVQHWRAITSAYRRAPFFEYYEHSLQALFEQKFERLIDFNLASIQWLQQQLRIKFEISFQEEYIADHHGAVDLRNDLPSGEKPYYQVFSDRTGFVEGLSVIDRLFCVGPSL